MLAASALVRVAVLATIPFFLIACDDDERKARENKYEVTIYVSDHIQGEIVNVRPERKFTKPRIEVHAPEGVTVVPKETKPRRTTVIDFAPLGSIALIGFVLTMCLLGLLGSWKRYARQSSFISPTYQRG